MARRKANIPANETPEAKFIRVANERVSRILSSLRQLGGLGNTSQYMSKLEQRKQIAEALTAAMNKSMDALNKGGEAAPEFKLK
jgi:hypothetical protein